MATLTAFSSRVTPSVLEAPDPVIQQAVLDSCIEFCEKSNIIRQTLSPIAVTAQQFTVTVTPPTDTKVVQIQRAWWNGVEIFPAQEDRVEVLGWAATVAGVTINYSQPQSFSEQAAGVIALLPRPDVAGELIVRCSLKPSRSATVVDDILLEDWVEPIAIGALARLFDMEAKWANPTKAEKYKKKFSDAIGDAIIESRRGKNRAEEAVRPVWV